MSVASIIFENAGVWPVAAAVLVALTAILLWFYPRQIHGIGLTGWLLPLLRWVGLGALAAMLLRPVLTQPAEKVAGEQVLAIVDTSKSMELVDSARTPAERVALARAFGTLPPGASDDVPTRLLSRIRELATFARNVINAQNDLEYARQVGRGVGQKQGALKDRIAEYAAAAQKLFDQQAQTTDPAIAQGFASLQSAKVGEASADWTTIQDRIRDLELQAANAQTTADQNLYATNPSVQKVCDDLASQNRLALALRALNVDREALSQGASDLRSFSLGMSLEPLPISRHGGKPLETSSALTDVAAGLGAAESIASDQSARAIVLLTDGHRGARRSDMASAIRPSGVPVYPVNVAANRISDVWISSISLNTSEVFRGQSVDGQVEVRYQGAIAPPTALTVQGSSAAVTFPLLPRIVRDGKPIGNSLIARFSIPISPPPGAVDELLRFSVASEAGEATVENNSAARWIKVYSNKLRVTVITGGPTWDVLNLEHLLQRMPWVQLNAVTLPSMDAHLVIPAALLLQDDILVLHDVPVRSLDPSQWDAVGRMVSDRGGTAIVIAGTGAWLAEYASQPLAAELLPFHDLRPVWRQWPGDTGAFHFTPTPLGIREAMELGDPADTARRWAETPGAFRYLQIPEKNCFSDVNHWLNESDTGTPVIIERPRGAGRLLFVGLDEMWRWGAGGDAYDQRIWQQMIHFAAGQSFAASAPDVEFDVGRIAVEPGASTPVRAWIRNAPSAVRSVQVEIARDGQPHAPLTLTARNGRFEGTLTPTEPGEYTLRLQRPARSSRGPRLTANPLATLPLHVLVDDALGFVNLASDTQYLKRIASASGGHYVTVEQIDELPRLLREVRNEDSQVARKPIYSSPLLLAFVLACLSAEWGLRKRAGLS